ncbi:TetR/AcrR family transcriptional regulator [Paraburkholderia sp. MM6662-R1]|uniref:TetR/AcrR family transcriptional regulator n=1 Tax=Paraburkholderia sp. MM6662-R1 TaxID=2991066 RepID=UPI003D1C54E2
MVDRNGSGRFQGFKQCAYVSLERRNPTLHTAIIQTESPRSIGEMPDEKTKRPAVARKTRVTKRPDEAKPEQIKPLAQSEDGPASQTTPGRNEKLRARTRGKLMQAARVVMSRRGIERTAINDITEEAQVAFGSFYNYFSSKEEIARAVFVEDVTATADLLDRNRPADTDIAMIVGLNIRWALRHAITDPIWGWFLVHAASSANDLVETMGGRLARDIRTGVNDGSFVCPDVPTAMDSIIGGVLYLLRQILEGRRPPQAIERFVEFVLRGLGVEAKEAARIVKAATKYKLL